MPEVTTDHLYAIRDTYFEGRFFDVADHAINFLDIVHDTPLSSLRPPQSVLDHPLLAEGFSMLARLGREQRLRVPLLLGAHGDERNFYDIAAQNRDTLEMAPAVGIEASWVFAEQQRRPGLRTVQLKTCGVEGREQFQQAEISWLADRDTYILPCEIENQSTEPLAVAFAGLHSIYTKATANAAEAMDETTRNTVRTIATGVYQASRHWAIVGQYGYWLRELDERNMLHTTSETAVPLILGSWHAPSAQKLQSFALSTEAYSVADHLAPTADYQRYGKAFMQMISTNRATLCQLAIPVPY